MPVHEIRYRTWEGELTSTAARLFAIPKFTLMAVFNKWMGLCMIFGIMQLITYTGYLLITTNPLIREAINMQQNFNVIAPGTIFRNFYLVQFLLCVVLCIIGAPRMISPEIQHKALPMIYSRTLSRFGYILGKSVGLFALLSLMTWVQTIVLFLLMMIFYPQDNDFWQFFWGNSVWLGIKSVAYGILMSLSLTLFALACSALTKNYRRAGVIFIIVLFGASFISFFIQENFMAGFPDLGLRDIFYSLGYKWFHTDPDELITYPKLFTVLSMWLAGSYAIMHWRLRPVEIYKG